MDIATTGAPAADLAALEENLHRLLGQGASPGLGLGVRQPGRTFFVCGGEVLSGGGRQVNFKTRFPMGCLIKPLLGLVCLELHQAGALDVDAPVAEYLPEFRRPKGVPIRLSHLLSHTAGYCEPRAASARWVLTWEDLLDHLSVAPQLSEPGKVWSYCHTGHAILARVVERSAGEPAINLVRRWILEPLAIEPGWRAETSDAVPHIRSPARGRFEPVRVPPETGVFAHSISRLRVSLEDLLVISSAIAGEGLPPSISSEAFDRFQTPVIGVPLGCGFPVREAVPTSFGLGLGRFGHLLGQNGSLLGTTCAIRCDPATSIAVAVAANAWAPGLRDWLADLALRVVGACGSPEPRITCAVDVPVGALAGRFACQALGMPDIQVSLQGSTVRIVEDASTAALDASLEIDSDGTLTLGQTSRPWNSFAVSQAPDNGDAFWMIGTSAYRRV